jgi:hypothetical protein
MPATNDKPDQHQRARRAPQARETRDVQRYLHALFHRESPGAYIEVRYRHRDIMRRHFFAHTDTFPAARAIARLGLSTDVYVGVAARRSRDAGGKDAIQRVWTLWADLDDVDAHDALEQLPVAPAILIASGSAGHLHAYWPLALPVSIAAAERANRRLAAQLHADDGAVTNAATILRPPGTYSHKTSPPVPVLLQRLDAGLSSLYAVTVAIADDPAPHVVPLAHAWRTGAHLWSARRREAFANDLRAPELVAVTAHTNRSKSDSAPDEWKPPRRAAWCLYARWWIDVKTTWRLTVTSVERRALRAMLRRC